MSDIEPPKLSFNYMIDTAEDTATKQVTSFIKEIGKWSAVIIVAIMGLLFADDQIPEAKVLLLLQAAQLLAFALVLYIVIKIVTRPVSTLKFNYDVMTKNFIDFQEFQNRFNVRMVGTVDALESYTELAIYETSIDTGEIVRTNANWVRMFGWTSDEVNLEFNKLDGGIIKSIVWFAQNFFAKEHRKLLQRGLTQRLMQGEIAIADYKEVKLRRRDGSEFPARMQIAVIRDNGLSYTKAFITDLGELKHKQAVIESLVSLVKMIDDHFGKNANKIQGRQKLIDEVKELRKDIKDGFR